MRIQDIYNRYGKQTTYNFDLMKIAEDLNITPFYYKMRDEIKDLRNTDYPVIYACINLHTSDQPGVHHSCFKWDKNNHKNNYFFDSYALPPIAEVKDLLKHATYNTFQVQTPGTSNCGQLSIFVLKQLHDNKDFMETILSLRK